MSFVFFFQEKRAWFRLKRRECSVLFHNVMLLCFAKNRSTFHEFPMSEVFTARKSTKKGRKKVNEYGPSRARRGAASKIVENLRKSRARSSRGTAIHRVTRSIRMTQRLGRARSLNPRGSARAYRCHETSHRPVALAHAAAHREVRSNERRGERDKGRA